MEIPHSFNLLGKVKVRTSIMDLYFSKKRKEVMLVSDDKKLYMTHNGSMADVIYSMGDNTTNKRFVLIEKTGT